MPGDDEKPMTPQTAEEHRRALGRLVRLSAHAIADICELLAELNGHKPELVEQTRLIEHAAHIRAEIREVCRPVGVLPMAPGRIVDTAPPEAPPEPPQRPANEGRKKSPSRIAQPSEYVGDFPKELFKK